MHLYHDDLEPPNNTMEVADTDAGRLEAKHWIDNVGWKVAPDPPAPQPGLAPEPVQYAPVGAPPLEDEVAELHERAEAVDLKVDKRWGVETLREKVEEAEADQAG